MPAQYSLPTYSVYLASIGIDILTYYQDPYIGDILQMFINDTFQYLNGNPLEQGNLIVIGKSTFLFNTDAVLDNNGNLLLMVQTQEEADKYSIDANGHLIYTTTV